MIREEKALRKGTSHGATALCYLSFDSEAKVRCICTKKNRHEGGHVCKDGHKEVVRD